MSKYKEGDRFIIELGTGQKGTGNMMYYRVKGANTYLTERELDRLVSMDNVLQRLRDLRDTSFHNMERGAYIRAIYTIEKGGVSNED